MNNTKRVPSTGFLRLRKPGLFRIVIVTVLLAVVVAAAARVNTHLVGAATSAGRLEATNLSPQSLPAAWEFETVSPVLPLPNPGCGPFVEITGFDYDPSNRPVIGWNLRNHCGGTPDARWARKESGSWNARVFEPNIRFPGGGDSDYAHQLALRADGTPFMVFGALIQPWNEYYATWQANLDTDPAGPGTPVEWLFHYRDCRQGGLQYALDFSPGATNPNWVTRTACPLGGAAFELKLNAVLFELGGLGSPGYHYATGPTGQSHVVHNSTFGALFYSRATSGSKLQIGTINSLSENLSIAVDANNRIHAAIGGFNSVADGDPGRLRYLTSTDGVTWTSTLIDNLQRHKSSVSIELDSAGNPAIAYFAASGGLWYAVLNNGQWQKSQVTPLDLTYVINHPRLVFDRNDVPHIAYYDGTAKQVRIASPLITNHEPLLANPGDQTNAEGDSVSLQLLAGDPDGDAVTYSATGLPPGLSIDPSSGMISGPLSNTSAGSYTVTVTASDGSLTKSETFTWVVTNTNHAPQASDASITTPEDTPATFTLVGTDADADSLTFSVMTQPAHGTVVLNGNSATYSPSPNFDGSDSFTFKANDGQADSNLAIVNLTITPVNDAPTIASPGDQTTAEGSSVSLQMSADDMDGNALSYSATSLPPGLNINPTSGLITGPLDFDSAGSYDVTVTVSDGNGGSSSVSFRWNVLNVNRAPSANDFGAMLNEDTSQTFTFLATDSDGDPLNFTVTSQPLHGVLTVSGVNLSYTPEPDYNGADSFTYVAGDGSLVSNTATVSLLVNPVDDRPVLATIGDQTVAEGSLLAFTLSGSDPDGDLLTYSADGLPTGASLDATSGAFSWTPNYDQAGDYTVTFTVTDASGLSASETITIKVTDVISNHGPVCSLAYPSNTLIWPPDHKQTIPISIFGVTDEDSDLISITITSILQDEPTNTLGDGSTWIDGGGTGTSQAWVRAERVGTPRSPGNGRIYEIFFAASDGRGKSCTGSVKVGVPHDQGQRSVPVDDGKRYDSSVAGGPCLNCGQ